METHISLFSNDEALIGFLREAVAESLGSEFILEAGVPSQVPSRHDLCVWDFIPGETVFPLGIDPNEWRQHLFLLHRKHLGALRAAIGVSDLNVLLKPLTKAALRAFLGGYGVRRGDRSGDAGGRVNTLRFERDEMLQVLIQANLKLQEFNQERCNFLARSIHEFRAPLTAISGYCELLLEEALDPLTSEQREVLERMQHSVRRLTRATDSVFQLSVAETLEPTLNLEKADIRDCIGRVLQDLSPVLENKRIPVMVDVEPSPHGLWFEKSKIEQALVNLLENACKFTPRGGAIEIRGYPFFWERRSAQTTGLTFLQDRRVQQIKRINSFRVDVRDSGPGIPAVHTEKIFEEYTSYSGGQDRSGAGLGLAICRMILSQHGGRVWAESSAGGAVFSFVLPLQQTDTPVSNGQNGSEKARLPLFVEN